MASLTVEMGIYIHTLGSVTRGYRDWYARDKRAEPAKSCESESAAGDRQECTHKCNVEGISVELVGLSFQV